MGLFLQREEYQYVNSDQKDTANGQSTKRYLLVCLMSKQNRQAGLKIFFHFVLTSHLYITYYVWLCAEKLLG